MDKGNKEVAQQSEDDFVVVKRELPLPHLLVLHGHLHRSLESDWVPPRVVAVAVALSKRDAQRWSV